MTTYVSGEKVQYWLWYLAPDVDAFLVRAVKGRNPMEIARGFFRFKLLTCGAKAHWPRICFITWAEKADEPWLEGPLADHDLYPVGLMYAVHQFYSEAEIVAMRRGVVEREKELNTEFRKTLEMASMEIYGLDDPEAGLIRYREEIEQDAPLARQFEKIVKWVDLEADYPKEDRPDFAGEQGELVYLAEF